MNKLIKIMLPILVFSMSIIGCSSNPKNNYSQEEALINQALHYRVEAKEYRETGNEDMARYFDNKADETVNRKDYGMFDFIWDLIFK